MQINSELSHVLSYNDPLFHLNVCQINNRSVIFDEILAAWMQRTTPILVGPAQSDTSSILSELARRIHERVLPGFQEKECKVFGGSVASLLGAAGFFGANRHLDRLFKKIADKRDCAILALAGTHLFKHDQHVLLRSYLDSDPRSIRYAVFSTTPEGALEFFGEDDGSLARRFRLLDVSNLTA